MNLTIEARDKTSVIRYYVLDGTGHIVFESLDRGDCEYFVHRQQLKDRCARYEEAKNQFVAVCHEK